MNDLAARCRSVLDRIRKAAERSGRDPATIRLIAVTKTVRAERIREAVQCGVAHIGENRLQEALEKQGALADLNVTWHFIGHIQTNKAAKIARAFDWVQSVDRIEAAQKLNQHAGPRRLPVLIEVKLHPEPAKSGVEIPHAPLLVENVRSCERLDLRGLMAIPPPSPDPETTRGYFTQLRRLAEKFGLPELSMGMTSDFEIAVEEGATMVRIGAALFGPR